MIREHEVVKAFIRSELDCYGKKYSVNEKQAIVATWWNQLNSIETPADFIVLKRISNMGLVEAELKVTQTPWVHGRSIIVLFPPSPKVGQTLTWSIVDASKL